MIVQWHLIVKHYGADQLVPPLVDRENKARVTHAELPLLPLNVEPTSNVRLIVPVKPTDNLA